LHELITQAAACTGRKISASAVVRALLRWAREKEHTSEIVALIEDEHRSGGVIKSTGDS
jgi:hypothetical protein